METNELSNRRRKSRRAHAAKNILRMSFGGSSNSFGDSGAGATICEDETRDETEDLKNHHEFPPLDNLANQQKSRAPMARRASFTGRLFSSRSELSLPMLRRLSDPSSHPSDSSADSFIDKSASSPSLARALPSNASLASLRMEIGKSAHKYLEECLNAEVSILDRDKYNAVPEYQKDQFSIVEHLGKGSYSDVFEVRLNVSIFDDMIERLGSLSTTGGPPAPVPKVPLKNDTAHDDIRLGTTGRRTLRAPRRRITLSSSLHIETIKRPSRYERQIVYAMKCLRPQVRSDPDQFIIGAEDLVHETALLATLNHPNIIRLHGRAAGHLKHAFALDDGYFILLDRLKKETLKDFIGEWWRYPEFYLQGPTLRQVDIALSIAEAIEYLHSKNIVYRDLKPANVGFDAQGVVKLFDFGFAVGLPSENDVSNPAGLLFDKCGTPRYMAPEVGLELGYRTEADVYSFGMLLWEICALKEPFPSLDCPAAFDLEVFVKGHRPSVKKHWPVLITTTIKKCWSASPSKRSSISCVVTDLCTVKASISSGDTDIGASHQSFILG